MRSNRTRVCLTVWLTLGICPLAGCQKVIESLPFVRVVEAPGDMEIRMPSPEGAPGAEPPVDARIEINLHGKLQLDDQEVSWDELEAALAELAARKPQARLLIVAAAATSMEDLLKALAVCNAADLQRVKLKVAESASQPGEVN